MKLDSLQLIYESKNSIVYHYSDNEYGFPLAIKVLRTDYPTVQQVEMFKNEYKLLKNLNISNVSEVVNYEKFVCPQLEGHGKPSIFFKFISGKSIRQHFSQQHNLLSFLKFAIKISNTLGKIHQKNIIHRDINSANIIIDDKEEIFIIDFGIATRTNLKTQHLGNPETLQGTINYISPEQTGRMNRIVDYRTDLYSLGVTFYEMLTGKVPFESSDPLELVHFHIAKPPIPPSEVNSEVPDIISKIVLKLLSKNAEDRYQSAFGLQYDLEKCLNEVQQNQDVKCLKNFHFELSQNDVSTKFQIPQKLYGRNVEIEILMKAFEEVSVYNNHIGTRLLLISGYSGTGKSALVNEIHRPITQKRGYFLSGKFDLYQRNVPYFAIIQALTQFAGLLLTEREEILKNWKKRILQAVGNVGKVLTDLIPTMELIIEKQPSLPDVEGKEGQNRFNFVMRNFIKVVATKEHPLVLFIDDLQWADSSSLDFILNLLTDKELKYLLFIGAYRSNEVSENHPLTQVLDSIEREKIPIQFIKLQNLKYEYVEQLTADTLHSAKGYKDLSHLIYSKTDGNAFFVCQFLQNLYEEGKLKVEVFKTLDERNNSVLQTQWQWNLLEIQEMSFSDNVLELMSHKIKKLSVESQKVLGFAACIGNEFLLKDLSIIFQKSEENTLEILEEPLQDGLIQMFSKKSYDGASEFFSYKFAHDRIHQAIYTLIPDLEKKDVHLRIGRLLFEHIPQNKQEERIFDIVNQWNSGKELIVDSEERFQHAALNWLAASRSKSSGAYKSALNYFQIGLTSMLMLDSDVERIWENFYENLLSFYEGIAETSYLSGDFSLCDESVEVVVVRGKNILDKIKAYEAKLLSLSAQQKFLELIRLGQKVLKMLDSPLPDNPSKLTVAIGLLKTIFKMGLRKPEEVLSYPIMRDRRALAINKIANIIGSPSYITMPNLYPLVSFKAMSLYKKYGLSPDAPAIFATYALIISMILGRIDRGYRYALMVTKLIDKLSDKKYKSTAILMTNDFVIHWKEPLRATFSALKEGYKSGLEVGNYVFASWCSFVYCFHRFLAGVNLDVVEREMSASNVSISQLKEESILFLGQLFHQAVLNILGKNSNPLLLVGDAYNENEKFSVHQKANDMNAMFNFYFLKSYLAFFMQEYEESLKYNLLAKKYESVANGAFNFPTHIYLGALIRSSLYFSKSKKDQSKFYSEIKKALKMLEKWSKYCPANHLHRVYLVQAELHRIEKQEIASATYNRAIDLAHENDFSNDEAIAYEFKARYHLENNQRRLANYNMENAYRVYLHWGNSVKAKLIESEHPEFLSEEKITTQNTLSTTITTMGGYASLDMGSIVKASQTLAGEIVLSRLLKKMMQIVIENAGAQKGFLILNKDGHWYVEAETNIEVEEMKILQSIPVNKTLRKDQPLGVSETVVNYVIRSQENVVLGEAFRTERFANDEHIYEQQVKALLCMPLINQGKMSGILYLENNLTTNAFTPKRIEVLKILSTQMAVSIENALLYENLEAKVKERTVEILKQKEVIEEKNHQITASINYASRIQNALLPNKEMIHLSAKEFFVLYLPKQIVSGDFYWFKKIRQYIVLSVADCTGHGVPGAFMSMLGIAFLNEIIRRADVTQSNQALNELRNYIKNVLQQTGKKDEARDGMDIAFCIIDTETRELQFAGANNPLIIVNRKERFLNAEMPIKMESGELGLYEIAGDKMPVGIHRNDTESFNNHVIKLEENDQIYLFSDGYEDQFGGEFGRKLLSKTLKMFLLENSIYSMAEQRERLYRNFLEWKGTKYEQLDDITVLGMKIF